MNWLEMEPRTDSASTPFQYLGGLLGEDVFFVPASGGQRSRLDYPETGQNVG